MERQLLLPKATAGLHVMLVRGLGPGRQKPNFVSSVEGGLNHSESFQVASYSYNYDDLANCCTYSTDPIRFDLI